MPELPEVEVTRKGLLPLINQGAITQLNVYQPKLRWPVPVKQLKSKLIGHSILDISRRGKYLLFETKNGFFLIHLGMSGHLKYLSSAKTLDKHDHVDMMFASNCHLRFYDPRRFGAFLWLGDKPFEHPLLNILGPEPLDKDFNARYLFDKTRRSNQAIKTFIMNQAIVVGIGNIYASEALFLSKVHPQLPASQLSLVQCQALTRYSKKVLKKAIKEGGTTLKDFAHTDGKPGYFSHSLNVYGKTKAPCVNCKTPIQKSIINQRSSYFCPVCQTI